MSGPLKHNQMLQPGDALFRVCSLSYTFPNEMQAISSIDLDIAKGDSIALVGRNGSGKTTLVKLLSALLTPDGGTILFKGKQLTPTTPASTRLKIGVLFQDPDDQLFGHTVMDDAVFGLRNMGFSPEAAELTARQALKRVGLERLAYKPPHNLSYGQKKRAALAGLLAMEPEILLLDEPFANLDPHQEKVLIDLLKSFSGTLICISHDLISLFELCDRAVVLDQGRVELDCPLQELISSRSTLQRHGLDFTFRLEDPPGPAWTKPVLRKNTQSEQDIKSAEQLASFRGYHYFYPDGTQALRSLELSLHQGERVAVVGENGAGKSTLLSCLAGLRQGQGEFVFAGEPVTRRRRRTLWREAGLVFQDSADQLFCSSVGEEIAFGLRRLGFSRSEIKTRVSRSLAAVRLDGFADRIPLHLSGGERKRLSLACVLAMNPKLIILDEPTAGLDPEGELLLLNILQDLTATLLLVSHDLFFIKALTHRTLVMQHGRIHKDVQTEAFLLDQDLGRLNGLSDTMRRRTVRVIAMLQHEHEQWHEHVHRHRDPTARHHTHEHRHCFTHSHPMETREHDHGRSAEKVPGHAPEAHDHDHETARSGQSENLQNFEEGSAESQQSKDKDP